MSPQSNAERFVDAFDMLLDNFIAQGQLSGTKAPDISPSEARALMWLGRHGATVMNELAQGLNMPLSTTTNLSNRLEKKGFISRIRSEQDRRIVLAALSRKGERLNSKFYEQRLAASKDFLSGLSSTEQEHLIQLFTKGLKAANSR